MTPQNLARTKERVAAKDPITTAALARLVKQAEEVLRRPIVSVMDKTTTPPSGDKHDYYSIGPYWWPDPDAPGGLPYIRRDGLVNPERGSNATDAADLEMMSRGLAVLLLAQTLSGDDRYGARAVQQIRAWFIEPRTRMNPHLRFGQAIPGITEGRGIGIIDTEELVEVMRLLMIVPPPQWTISDALGLKNWMTDYVDWLLASDLGLKERNEHNNHGTWYDAQVAWFSLYCDRQQAAREIIRGVLDRRIAKHVDIEGKQPHEWARTRPMSYTCFNLDGLMQLADAGDEVGINLWRAGTPDGRSIKRACEWVMPYTQRAWKMELDPPETREKILPLLRRAALSFGDARFEKAIESMPREDWAPMRFNLIWPKA